VLPGCPEYIVVPVAGRGSEIALDPRTLSQSRQFGPSLRSFAGGCRFRAYSDSPFRHRSVLVLAVEGRTAAVAMMHTDITLHPQTPIESGKPLRDLIHSPMLLLTKRVLERKPAIFPGRWTDICLSFDGIFPVVSYSAKARALGFASPGLSTGGRASCLVTLHRVRSTEHCEQALNSVGD